MIAIVSSMLILQYASFLTRAFQYRQVAPICNMGAMLCRSRAVLFGVIAALLTAASAAAHGDGGQPTQPREHRPADTGKFLAGVAMGFAEHEADHLFFDLLFDAHPYVKVVHFGPMP